MDVEDDETSKLPPSPYLPHELIVAEILVRLPVKSLLRFRCVCNAWRDTVSGDASFSQAYLRRLHGRNMRPSSLLIAPYIQSVNHDGVFVDEFAIPGLYLWEENQRQDDVATLVHDMAWFPAEDGAQLRHMFAHCDGLVVLPAVNGIVRVLNPATRRSLTLPWSPNCATPYSYFEGEVQNTFGFGRDPSSGAYKVARFFHRDPYNISKVGMEVFTIGEDRCWHETAAEPLYPFIEGRTATFFKGSLIWTVDLRSLHYHEMHFNDAAQVPCIVRFNLEDESFSIVPAPGWYPEADYEKSRLTELHGELALTRLNDETVEIWMCDDIDGVNTPRWVHVLNSPSCVRLVAAFDDGIVFQDILYYLYRRTNQGSKHMVGMTTLKYRNPDTDTLVEYSRLDFDDFDVIPYIPTLVPI